MNGHSDHFFVAHDDAQAGQPVSQKQGESITPELVVSLVEKFYNSSNLTPAEIANTNNLLVQIQNRTTSLDLPEKLLLHPSSTVRFYAAGLLESLASKLSPELGQDKKTIVKNKYIQYVVYAIDENFGNVEFTKLSRACAALYVSVRDWPDCFRQIIHAAFPGQDLGEYDRLSHLSCAGQKLADVPAVHTTDPGMGQLLSNRNDHALQAQVNAMEDSRAVLLATFMLVMLGSLEPMNMQLPDLEKVQVDESFISTCQSFLPMISAMLNKQSLLGSKVPPTLVISSLLKHTMFLQSSAPAEVESKVEYLTRSVWLQVLQKLTTSSDGATWKSVEEVMDTVFQLHRDWVSQETLNDLLDFTFDSDAGLFACADAGYAEDEARQLAARRMCKDLAAHGLEANVMATDRAPKFFKLLDFMAIAFELDDDACEWGMQVIMFWSKFAERLQDMSATIVGPGDRVVMQSLVNALLHAITFIFPKLATPEDPDDELRETLADVQADLNGLICQAYILLQGNLRNAQTGNPIPAMIMQTSHGSTAYGTATPEFAVRTLSGLAELFVEDAANDPIVCQIFYARLFNPVADAYELTEPLKSREVDACIEFLEEYALMLARNPIFLEKVLEFLFSILQTDVNAHDPEVGRAIKAICLACRTQLIGLFDVLIRRYQFLQEEGIYVPEAKVNILASFGIIAHAVDKANGNLNAITRAIKIIEEEVETFLSIPDPEENTFTQDGLDALQTILELGKLIRSGSSKATAISLDDDDTQLSASESPSARQAEELKGLITNLMSTLASSPLLGNNDEAFRTIWDTLRLSPRVKPTDYHTAIFDFNPQIYLEVLKLCLDRNVTADYAMETFGQMLSAKYTHDAAAAAVAREAFPLCIQFMSKCSHFDDGGDSLLGPLKLLLTYIEACPDIVDAHSADFPQIVDLVTPSIRSSNVFTQEAACDVWRTLLRSNESFLQSVSESQLQAVALSVVQQISGEALERSIAPLSGVLAAMGARGGPCKATLEGAFKHLEEQGVKVANWSRFLQQIFMLRGSSADTKRVTEQFWKADRLAKAQMDGAVDESEEEAEIVLLDD